jgi:undecaprenyl-diphosphatase
VDRATAAEFSFFLAMPTMLGATVYDLYKNWSTLDWHGGGTIAIGFLPPSSAALSWWAVRALHQPHGFGVFAWYRIAVGTGAVYLPADLPRDACFAAAVRDINPPPLNQAFSGVMFHATS